MAPDTQAANRSPKRDFVGIDDLSNVDIVALMELAAGFESDLSGQTHVLSGHILGSLFLEPSTRTRLSFESAMNRLGGRVITTSEIRTSSLAKGESLADTVRTIASYSDVIVLRHPSPGAALLAAEYAPCPVINAGDGGHEHPTQTLCDLYILRKEKGRIQGLVVILYGDLRYGRTTHSLAVALCRFGASVLCVAQKGLELPPYVVARIVRDLGYRADHVVLEGLDAFFRRPRIEALLLAPDGGEGPGAPPEDPRPLPMGGRGVDAIYVTRLQTERLRDTAPGEPLPCIDASFFRSEPFRETVILHPLPRLAEISYDLDMDPRSAYFRQAAGGVPIRMALLAAVLGARSLPDGGPVTVRGGGTATDRLCPDPTCVSRIEGHYVKPSIVVDARGIARCRYCETNLA